MTAVPWNLWTHVEIRHSQEILLSFQALTGPSFFAFLSSSDEYAVPIDHKNCSQSNRAENQTGLRLTRPISPAQRTGFRTPDDIGNRGKVRLGSSDQAYN